MLTGIVDGSAVISCRKQAVGFQPLPLPSGCAGSASLLAVVLSDSTSSKVREMESRSQFLKTLPCFSGFLRVT